LLTFLREIEIEALEKERSQRKKSLGDLDVEENNQINQLSQGMRVVINHLRCSNLL
jgi:hypothetical protein